MTVKLATIMLLSMTMAAHGAVTKAAFGKTPDGKAVDIYTLTSDVLEARITTYGARIVSLEVPDREGKKADIVLGFNSLPEYEAENDPYFGAIVGRYGNRIAHGSFKLDGKTYQIPKNDHGINALHGGKVGFDRLVWQGREIPGGVEMTLVSKDGDQGFPGTLTAHVRYTLHHNALRIDYSMSSDKDTVVNLTNHSYFNLSGEGNGTILHDEMTILADKFTPIDAGLIPTGKLEPVEGTPFDFRTSHVIGSRIHDDNQQLKYAGGYDFNWVLRGAIGETKTAARAYDPVSGRVLTVTTTEPGVQFYSGNFLDGTLRGKSGKLYVRNGAFCLETQHFPDSPNHSNFPSTELKAGTSRHSTTTFTFTTHAK